MPNVVMLPMLVSGLFCQGNWSYFTLDSLFPSCPPLVPQSTMELMPSCFPVKQVWAPSVFFHCFCIRHASTSHSITVLAMIIANGPYFEEAIKVMSRTCVEAENSRNYNMLVRKKISFLESHLLHSSVYKDAHLFVAPVPIHP